MIDAENTLSYRIGGTLKFDRDREGYILDGIKRVSKSHAITDYIEMILKMCFENPQAMIKNEKYIQMLVDSGITPMAKEFFDKATKEVNDMHNKIDEIYNMCIELKALAMFGKRTGLDQRADNMLTARFLAERQLMELCSKLGIRDMKTFEENKIFSVEDKAAVVLEYILNSYDGEVREIVTSATPVIVKEQQDTSKTSTFVTEDEIEEGQTIEEISSNIKNSGYMKAMESGSSFSPAEDKDEAAPDNVEDLIV